jgi:aryl-alcohol dehydrogenase-like predicted oxidoreductase
MRKMSHVESNIAASDAPPLSAEFMAELKTHRWNRTVDWE